jgi:hypothetical protein
VASARELLEQADALMRKNRSRGDGDIPLLTDAVAIVAPLPAAVSPVVSAPAPMPVVSPVLVAVAPHADVPLLTDTVEDVFIDFAPLPAKNETLGAIMEGDPSDWLVMDTIDPASHSITGRAPDTLAVVPPMTLKAAGSQATPPPMGSQARDRIPTHLEQRAPAPIEPRPPVSIQPRPPAPVQELPLPMDEQLPPSLPPPKIEPPAESATADADQELWRALAEQISMQVLQRLDLFTDTGLKEQLAQRLEPIVERASAELVGAITEHVGRLVRTYVSEAIEREIAQWKRDQH